MNAIEELEEAIQAEVTPSPGGGSSQEALTPKPTTPRHAERPRKPVIGMLSLFSVMFAGTYLILLSGEALLRESPPLSGMEVIGHMVLLALGVGCVLGGVGLARKSILLDHFVGRTFEEEILTRMEPVLAQMAGVEERLDELSGKWDEVSLGLHRLEARGGGEGLAKGEGYETLLRYLLLANLTVGLFIFAVLYQAAYVPYAITVVFVLWWVAVTADFELWRNTEAWAWAALPILTVPVVSILMFAVLRSLPALLTVMAVAMAGYVYGYYAWARYRATGVLPLGIHRGELD
jgi:hypothetical protein